MNYMRFIDPSDKWYFGNRKTPDGYEQFNEDWALSPEGDMSFHNDRYYISHDRLKEDDWILHLMGKGWFDANTFLPAYFEACRRNGIKVVKIRIQY